MFSNTMLTNTMFSNMIMNNTDTGNVYLDYILSYFIIILLTLFINNFKQLKKNIFSYLKYLFLNKKRVEINIVAHNLNNGKSSKLDYSSYFKAVCYCIKIFKPIDVYVKREPDRVEKTKNPEMDVFIPDQDIPFYLDSFRDIQCIMRLEETEPREYNNDNSRDIYTKRSHSLTIFSDNPSIKISDLEDFLEECLKRYKSHVQNTFNKNQHYFSFLKADDDDGYISYSENIFYTNRTFNTIFFEQKQSYLKSLNFFLNNEKWYQSRGIPYHYGIFLHGTPGCGKTSIIKATIEYTKRHVLVIPLNRIKTCGQLESVFFNKEINSKVIPMENRIYIFEDIDCLCDIIKSRELKTLDDKNNDTINKKSNAEFNLLMKIVSDKSTDNTYQPDDELTLSCFLNIIDGVQETPGRIIIMTSNYPGEIDKAILRPGRIDFNIELKKASIHVLNEILSFFYDIPFEDVIEMTSNMAFKDYDMSPAEIMNICQQNYDNIKECINCIDSIIFV